MEGRFVVRKIVIAIIAMLVIASCVQPPPSETRTEARTRGASQNAARVTFVTSAARTAAFTSDAQLITGYRVLTLQLDVTAASGTTPTLDVKVQTTVDGTNWCDVAAFAQVTAVARRTLRIVTDATPAGEAACTDGTLAAGTVNQGPLGQFLRVKHALPGGATPSFTYSVTGWLGE